MSLTQTIRIEEIPGKGTAITSLKPLKHGHIVLTDSPILLYSTKPLIINPQKQKQNQFLYCDNCFTFLNNSNDIVQCGFCEARFCTSLCFSEAVKLSHNTWVCSALRSLKGYRDWDKFPEEFQVQARFLVAAYNLCYISPIRFTALMSVQGEGKGGEGVDNGGAFTLHSIISSLCPVPDGSRNQFHLETTAALLAKDKLNAFGIMEPFIETSHSPKQSEEQQIQQRSVRAYGIYQFASLFNHDCLPNACRFDYFDHKNADSSSSKSNTDIVIRLIHDIPAGREICLSYFPVNLSYRERQLRLKDDYGFVCTCDRCQVEANWSDDEDDGVAMDEDDEKDESMEAGEQLAGEEEEDGSNMDEEGEKDFPHAYFFLRYMCTRQDCWGTLAPLPTPPSLNGTTTPPSSMATVMECNVCGNLKNDEEEVAEYLS